MIYRNKENKLVFLTEELEVEFNKMCKDEEYWNKDNDTYKRIDKELRKEILEKLSDVLNGNFFYDMLDALADEVYNEFEDKEVPTGTIFTVIDSYADRFWPR